MRPERLLYDAEHDLLVIAKLLVFSALKGLGFKIYQTSFKL